MTPDEQAIVFECGGQRMVGIVHGAGGGDRGVLLIVGGPQTRVGSHRQFLLLARYLASNNIPVMRFDYRGIGDSEGDTRTFEDVSDDIRSANDTFFKSSPGLQSIALWGLCDAASAALFYGHTDSRVQGIVLLNPWVRTEQGQAKTYLRHYYLKRLFDTELWVNVWRGKFELKKSLASLLKLLTRSRGGRISNASSNASADASSNSCSMAPLPQRMYEGLERFQGWVGIIISGDDLTAAEFEGMIKASRAWQTLLRKKGVEFQYLPEANHTFSRQVWRDQVAKYSLQWVLR